MNQPRDERLRQIIKFFAPQGTMLVAFDVSEVVVMAQELLAHRNAKGPAIPFIRCAECGGDVGPSSHPTLCLVCYTAEVKGRSASTAIKCHACGKDAHWSSMPFFCAACCETASVSAAPTYDEQAHRRATGAITMGRVSDDDLAYIEQVGTPHDASIKAMARELIERRAVEAKAWDCVRRFYAAFFLDKAGVNLLAKVDAIEFAHSLAREAGVNLE